MMLAGCPARTPHVQTRARVRALPGWRSGAAALVLCLGLPACAAAPTAAPADPTAFVKTRVAELLTQSALTPAVKPPSIRSSLAATPEPTATRMPTLAAVAAPPTALVEVLRLWMERPIPAGYTDSLDRTYAYGSTQDGAREPHHGVEFFNPAGTPVVAVAAGAVIAAGDDAQTAYGPHPGFYGQLVVVQLDRSDDGRPLFTLYAHLSRVLVEVGQRVDAGEVVGLVGQTGIAIGPHLHFEVRLGVNEYAATRNPELWLRPLSKDGQPWGAIAGQVTDRSGQVLFGLPVVIRPVSVSEPVRARFLTTYARETLNGDDQLRENFATADLPPGVYRVSVNTTTFYEQTVVVEPGRIAQVSFSVNPPVPTPTATP